MQDRVDISEILELWSLAAMILDVRGCRAVNLSGGAGGHGDHRSECDWAMTYRGYATEDEHNEFTSVAIYNTPSSSVHRLARRFAERLPEIVYNQGIVYLQVL